jgi:hypothetical protein
VAEKVEIIVTAQDKASGVLSKIAGAFTKAGLVLTAGVTAPLVVLGAKAVGAASDLAEATNAVNTVFGDASQGVLAFGQIAAGSVGLANAEFNQLAAVSGALLQNLGFDANAAGTEVITLAQRAADMASVFNTDVDQALGAVNSALKGEFNPLEQFGVKLNAADIAAKALELGLADTAAELDNNAKAQAALAIIYEQTDRIAGDFINTSDGLANSQRILEAQFQDVSAQLGAILIPYVQQFVDWVSGLLDVFQGLSPEMQKFAVIGGVIVAALGPLFLIIGAIIPVVTALAGIISGPLILAIALIVGAVALLTAAWTQNWFGIQEVVAGVIAWFQTYVAPVFTAVLQLLSQTMGIALSIAAQFWTSTLLPALQAVWSFIQANVLPLIIALAGLIEAVLGVALTAVAGLIQNIVIPAMQKMGDWVQKNLMPAISSLASWLNTKLAPAFSAISGAIQTIIGWIQNLTKKFENITLPDWLTPGSPTPFEMGLRGIDKELSGIAKSSLPSFSVGLADLGAPSLAVGNAASVTTGTAVNVYFSYQGVSLGDRVEAERVLAPVVGKLVRDNIEALS